MAEASTVPVFSSFAQFKAAYAAVSDEVFLIDAQTKAILAVNKAFQQTFGYDPLKPYSFKLSNFVPEDVLEQLEPGFSINLSLSLPKGRSVSLMLQVQEVLLDNELQLLCLTSRQGRETVLEDIIAAADTEKKALLNEVYHRVKNNLNIIVSLLSLQLNRVKEPVARHLLLESKSRIYTLALLQERLYASPRVSEIQPDDYLCKVAQSVVASFKKPQQEVHIGLQVETAWMNVDLLLPLGLIVHELVSNAVQHAFAEGSHWEVGVKLEEKEPGLCQLSVEDNGCGLSDPQLFENSKSATLGIQLVLSLLRQLKGSFAVETAPQKGTRVVIQFPKP